MFGIDPKDEKRNALTGELETVQETGGALGEIPAPPSSPVPAGRGQSPLSAAQQAPQQGGGAGATEAGGFDAAKDRGNPTTLARDTVLKDPDSGVSAMEDSAKFVSNQRGKGRQVQLQTELMNEQLGLTGKEAEAAKETMQTQAMQAIDLAESDGKLTKKQAKKKRFQLKNVFNTIKPEEMSLFLIDFGMRAMMAGETMGDLGALGAAGSGALGGIQERRRFAEQQEIEASERERMAALEERGVAADEMRAGAAQTTAQAALTRAEAADRGYTGEKVWLENFFKEAGKSDEEIADYFMRAEGGTARRQSLTDALMKRIEKSSLIDSDPILGKKYVDFTEKDMQDWVDRVLAEEQSRAGGGALSSGKGTSDYIREAGGQ